MFYILSVSVISNQFEVLLRLLIFVYNLCGFKHLHNTVPGCFLSWMIISVVSDGGSSFLFRANYHQYRFWSHLILLYFRGSLFKTKTTYFSWMRINFQRLAPLLSH